MAGIRTGRNSERRVAKRRDKRIAALTEANINQKDATAEATRRNSQANARNSRADMMRAKYHLVLQDLKNKGRTDTQALSNKGRMATTLVGERGQTGREEMRQKGLGDRLLAEQTYGAEQTGEERDFKREQGNLNLAGKGLLQGALTGLEAQGVANSGAYVPNLTEITTKNKGGYQYIKPVFEESYSPESGRFEKMPVTSGKVFNPATGEVVEQVQPGGEHQTAEPDQRTVRRGRA